MNNFEWPEEKLSLPVVKGPREGNQYVYKLPENKEKLYNYMIVADSMTNNEYINPPINLNANIITDKDRSRFDRIMRGSGKTHKHVGEFLMVLELTDMYGQYILWQFLNDMIIIFPRSKYFKNRIKPLLSDEGYREFCDKYEQETARVTLLEISVKRENTKLAKQLKKYVNRTIKLQNNIGELDEYYDKAIDKLLNKDIIKTQSDSLIDSFDI